MAPLGPLTWVAAAAVHAASALTRGLCAGLDAEIRVAQWAVYRAHRHISHSRYDPLFWWRPAPVRYRDVYTRRHSDEPQPTVTLPSWVTLDTQLWPIVETHLVEVERGGYDDYVDGKIRQLVGSAGVRG